MLDADIIRAFVISLTHARTRQDNIRRNLGHQIAYEFVNAVNGADIRSNEKQYCKSLYCARFHRKMSHNEVACAASHRKALLRFMESGAQYALILEDDAHIPAENFQKISAAIAALGQFDILKLGGVGPRVTEGIVKAAADDFHILAVLTFGACTHAYVVSRAGASKLSSTIFPVREPYDAFMRNINRHKCTIFESSPWLIGLGEECALSTIGGERKTLRYSYSLREIVESFKFRIEYNVMKRVYNIRRFGLAYITRSGFTKTMPSGEQSLNMDARRHEQAHPLT